MNSILIAPNSFKECAYSTETAEIIFKSLEKYLIRFHQKTTLVKFPVADGGDGFLNVIKEHFNTETLFFKIPSLIGEAINDCPVEYSFEKRTLYIESAQAIGLKLAPPEKRNPLVLNSGPLGKLLLEIDNKVKKNELKVEKVIIGIGGTATNDLGAGFLSCFGLKLYDKNGEILSPVPARFLQAEKIEMPKVKLNYEVQVVLDVENPLLGETGASRVFAKQKGAGEKGVRLLEEGFGRLLNLMNIEDEQVLRFSGAGGGIAAAFQLFFGAETISSERFILDFLNLASLKNEFSLVITGEGALDSQTFMNKGAMIVYSFFRKFGLPVCFICGENKLSNKPDFLDIIELKNFFKNKEESIKNFTAGIDMACREIVNKYSKNLKG